MSNILKLKLGIFLQVLTIILWAMLGMIQGFVVMVLLKAMGIVLFASIMSMYVVTPMFLWVLKEV